MPHPGMRLQSGGDGRSLPGRELDAFEVDEVLHRYQRAARELRKFCWLAGAGAGVERTARVVRDIGVHRSSISA
jgi:hypothetical protein